MIVTTFTAGQQQTLPIWMLEELISAAPAACHQRGGDGCVVIVTFLPILAAFYPTRGGNNPPAGAGK